MDLPTLYQSYIHMSKYSRFQDAMSRRELWPETVQRYFDFFVPFLKEKHGLDVSDHVPQLYSAVHDLESMPSMRALMTAGPALQRDHIAGYNCAYREIDSTKAFAEIMFILMCGTGISWSVERQVIKKLPKVPDTLVRDNAHCIHVRDSKRGWASAIRELLQALYDGRVPSWDTSKVRAYGTRLKKMGGRASGPEPLIDAFKFIVHTFDNARGRQLTSTECHDIACVISDAVVVGGVRRAAALSLSNLSDQRMRDAKTGAWWETHLHRRLANNSTAFTERPEVGQFMQEWMSLYESKSGERGIFNREAARNQAMQSGRRRGFWDQPLGQWTEDGRFFVPALTDDEEYWQAPIAFGTNPCVSGDTQILTSRGYKQIKDCVGRDVEVWNGENFAPVTPFSTGDNPTVTVMLSDGTSLRCTPYHEWLTWEGWSRGGREVRKRAADLKPGDKLTKYEMPVVHEGQMDAVEIGVDAYSQGFYAGDGNDGLTWSWVYEPKYDCVPRLEGRVTDDGDRPRKRWHHGVMRNRRFVPVHAAASYCLEWFAGLLDADGVSTQDENGSGFQIASIDRDFLLRVRLMLSRLGVRAKVVDARAEGSYNLPDGRGGMAAYDCSKVSRILIGNEDADRLMSLGMQPSRVRQNGSPQRDAREFIRVVSVEDSGPCETFCFNEPTTNRGTFNGIVTGQCAEIILRSEELCNLSSFVARPDDTDEDLERKVRNAAIMGTWQACLTDFRFVGEKWRRNCEEERLLGVSLSGMMDCPLLNDRHDPDLPERLEHLKQCAIEENYQWAKALDINPAAAITCVKPEGNSSQLVASASGIHPEYAHKYIRRVRQSIQDPLTQFMIDKGFVGEPERGKEDRTMVFSFPRRIADEAMTRDDMTAIDQLEHWKLVQDHYCEHKPSITVYVRENEWPEVGGWVWKHFDQMSGVSFLPFDGGSYHQAPYEEVGEDELQKLEAAMPSEIDWSELGAYESTDNTTGSRELACVSGACEIR